MREMCYVYNTHLLRYTNYQKFNWCTVVVKTVVIVIIITPVTVVVSAAVVARVAAVVVVLVVVVVVEVEVAVVVVSGRSHWMLRYLHCLRRKKQSTLSEVQENTLALLSNVVILTAVRTSNLATLFCFRN